MQADFPQRVRAGERLLGSFAFLPSPGLVEVLGRAGLDHVIIDQEHSRKGWDVVENMVRAADAAGIAALVRVAWNDEKEILHVLETGAAGIVLPFVESAADVRRAAAALRYAPEGTRGTCTQTRAAGYGSRKQGFVQYAQACNRQLLLVGQIESRKGLENIEEIVAAQPGLDVVFLGRSDLASDLGKPGQTHDPEVEAATGRIVASARAAGKVVGIAHYEAAEVATWGARGCSFFALASESGFLLRQVARFVEDAAQSAPP
ncbi:4-hydroxy-2-oxovalerate aldolase [Ramlibacter sp. G-1-2-2]|uniref:4-hydroxy-2-oxovalerate aldolase n=1 Tax=Ramlibacter agri TaxID=2728837 RepID=A0A848H3Z7_9BURK|nr:aldolase/citrate lyase family protein [Ramlibacter agri]NML45706.1 4-hydroxy-2-oxovalerate aldolase [Ramlibacter agri]